MKRKDILEYLLRMLRFSFDFILAVLVIDYVLKILPDISIWGRITLCVITLLYCFERFRYCFEREPNANTEVNPPSHTVPNHEESDTQRKE